MNYKNLMDFTNATVFALNEAMGLMGLDEKLVWVQMAKVFKDKAKTMLSDIGFASNGKDIKSITESFAKQIKEIGLCQRVNILEVNNDKIVLDMGECVLAPATHMIAKSAGDDFIPACPMAAILYAKIEEVTGRSCSLEKFERKLAENTSIFTIKVE